MSYAVVHMQKLKGQAIKRIQFHNQRERDSSTKNALSSTVKFSKVYRTLTKLSNQV
ncbi:plasmid recombination protein [Sediminibacillus albus]|uniref:plasmid recombination protein n=1 Tax=Sediminibacillus albus TaxID=407036 RepID=UPI00111340A7|nr:plasmid recombination protein [Sediminibacillus albus]